MNVTLVTGLWDLGRENLEEGWSRTFDHYKSKLEQLLDVPYNLIVFGDSELKTLVLKTRAEQNTQFIERPLSWFKSEFFDKIQTIRTDPQWFNQVGWLKDSTQAKLEYYNPLVMSKMFLLNDARIMDKFNSSHLYWIDAGITNTVHPGYFIHDGVLDKIKYLTDKFTFIAFPYATGPEIHGFDRKEMENITNSKVERVCRGGFFGGSTGDIEEMNSSYYELMSFTLNSGLMGTEESLFTIMSYTNPNKFYVHEIGENGLIYKFFEDLKEVEPPEVSGVNLYVLGFNSPSQFKTLIESYLKNGGFITDTNNFLINNSTDESTYEEYDNLCEQFNFEHIKHDNIGICGGRQLAANHFDKTTAKYYIFLEDDMSLHDDLHKCKCGFDTYTKNLYNKIIKIMDDKSYDFLKFSFSEFYGDNSKQWSWYNVPIIVKDDIWPGLKCAPKTKFNNIYFEDDLPYVDGEIYYCNWPQIVSRSGNTKMFLETTWDHPHEQTWMSYIYQKTRAGYIKPAILLISPINHNRFDHYDKKDRKES